jgi:hypothetical protein
MLDDANFTFQEAAFRRLRGDFPAVSKDASC